MRLRHWSVMVAGVLAVCGGRGVAQGKDGGAAGAGLGGKTIDLLKLVDPVADSCEGKWIVKDGALVFAGQARGKVNLPYHPPEEYDYHVQFVRDGGKGDVVLILSFGGKRQFAWVQSGWNNTVSGFDRIAGKGADKNPTSIHSRAAVESGKPYDVVVKVRKDGLETYVNGQRVSQWKTTYEHMQLATSWRLKDAEALGVGTKDVAGDVRFSKIEVTEITGAGEIVKHDATASARVARSPRDQAPAAEKLPAGGSHIDVDVACAKPDPAAAPVKVDAAADLNAIERPAYRNRPKALVKDITSVTAMMVQADASGEMIGLTSDIIATVDPDSRRSEKAGIGILRTDGDESMRVALQEAVRAVRLRYPIWEPGHIDLSFGEKFVMHGGPSAGTAFGLLMLSTLEGFELDPKCAVTGDITVDWKVRKVGGVTAKLHGATLDKCLYAAIPEDNETAFADMALLYGDAALWDIQVFSIGTLQDAEAVARKHRDAKLAEAITLFDGLRPELAAGGEAALKKPETRKTLAHILQLAPNHLSAKYLLAIADGTASKTLSANATFYRLDVIMYPYYTLLSGDEAISRATLPAAVTLEARKALGQLRGIANKDALPLLVNESGFIEAMDQFAGNPSVNSLAQLRDRYAALQGRFAQMAGDEELLEKLRREGY